MDKESFDASFAQRVEQARNDKGLSRKALSDEARIELSALHRKLAGIGSFTVAEVDRISAALGVNCSLLWSEVDA
jgi:ribosome-binding protein aMBF1 (putative translation factor)